MYELFISQPRWKKYSWFDQISDIWKQIGTLFFPLDYCPDGFEHKKTSFCLCYVRTHHSCINMRSTQRRAKKKRLISSWVFCNCLLWREFKETQEQLVEATSNILDNSQTSWCLWLSVYPTESPLSSTPKMISALRLRKRTNEMYILHPREHLMQE